MKTHNTFFKQIAKFVFLLMLGLSMDACSKTSNWKEEVLLHDGSKIIVGRVLSYGGRHEIGQPNPISESTISFVLPNSNKTISWTSNYSSDVGRANFDILALHILDGRPYIVASPIGCLSYNKWGRPNPPYVFFKYDGKEWQRIPLSEFPVEFKTLNVVIYLGGRDVETMVKQGLVSAENIRVRNSELSQYPQYQTILREPVKGYELSCPEMVSDGKNGWIGVGWFKDQPSYQACLNYCTSERIAAVYCLCNKYFQGK